MLDPAKLLKPLSSTSPVGDNLRYFPVYDEILEARRLPPDLPMGVWEEDKKKVDWRSVEALCVQALQKSSKDLQGMVFLTEALSYLEGVTGMAQGLNLMLEAFQCFGETLPPADPEAFSNLFEWADPILARAVDSFKLSPPGAKDGEEVTLGEWKTGDRDALHRALGKNTQFLEESKANVDEALEYLFNLTMLASKFSSSPSSFPLLKAALHVYEDTLSLLLEAVLPAKPQAVEKVEALPTEPPLASRAQTYETLRQIAQTLYQQEPHSVVPLLLFKICAWEKKSFGEILQDCPMEVLQWFSRAGQA